MRSAFRFRLYPNLNQEAKMLRALETTRRLWNDALAHRRMRWENDRQATSYNLQAGILTAERERGVQLGELHSQVGQDALRRLDRAFKSFFEGRAKYPRFKRFRRSGSFTYPQAYNGSVKPDVERKRLFVSKVGNVRVVFHRPIPKDSTLKTCTILREPDGKWFASLVFEEVVPLQNIRMPAEFKANAPIGVDLGLLSLIATSEGEKVEHPRFLRKAEKRLEHLDRNLSHKKKGSKNSAKGSLRVASQHCRVRRQRLDFNQKLSTKLLREHGFIAFEDLRIKNMVKNSKLAKSILDAGWGQLVRFTEDKALRTNSIVIRVPAAYSTQECSYCGTLNRVNLDIRSFECVSCRRSLDRDIQAARVVLKRGLAIAGLTITKIGQGMPQFKPAETQPLLIRTTGGASQVKESGTTSPQRAGSPRL